MPSRLPVLAVLCALASLVTACASNPARLPLIDPEGVQGRVHDVYIATSRSPAEIPERRFGTGRGHQLAFAEASVWVPFNREPGSVELPRRHVDPERQFALTGYADIAGEAAFRAEINARLAELPPGERNIFLFTHGFNTPFSDGLYLNAQILNDFGVQGVAIHYAWPSAGQIPAYLYDRDSAQFARDDLARTLEIVAESDAVSITVLAHSMGALVTMEALRQLSLQGRADVITRIDPLILASPDIDFDVFRTQINAIEHPPEHVAIFVSSRDRALALSDTLRGGGHPRVGSGANREELNEMGVAVIDLSDLRDGVGFANHVTFASSQTLMQLSTSGVLSAALMGEPTHVRSTGIGALTDLAAQIIYLPARALGER